MSCEKCEGFTPGIANMEDLKLTRSENIEGFKASGIELILPDSKLRLSVHLPLLGDEKRVQALMEEMKKNDMLKDPSTDRAYLRRIVCIDKVNDEPIMPLAMFDKMMDWMETDYDYLRDEIVKRSVGIDTNEVPAVCNICSTKGMGSIFFDAEFFRPAVS